MRITDYGLWFYCIEEGIFFNMPKEFTTYMQSTYKPEELEALTDQAIPGTSGYITRSCDIVYNGSDIETCLKMRYLPKIKGIMIETNRAKKILESECYKDIIKCFKVMSVKKQQNKLGQALVLSYREDDSRPASAEAGLSE